MTRRDEHLWEEEVVEIFLDLDRSGRDYAELEISPANVVCDVRMTSTSPKEGRLRPGTSTGLETRVHLQKDGAGQTTGWTATAFLPWNGFRALPSARPSRCPPAGDRWRFNLFRVERPGGKASAGEGRRGGRVVGAGRAELPRPEGASATSCSPARPLGS